MVKRTDCKANVTFRCFVCSWGIWTSEFMWADIGANGSTSGCSLFSSSTLIKTLTVTLLLAVNVTIWRAKQQASAETWMWLTFIRACFHNVVLYPELSTQAGCGVELSRGGVESQTTECGN